MFELRRRQIMASLSGIGVTWSFAVHAQREEQSAASVCSGNTPPPTRGRASQHFGRRSNSLDGRRTAMLSSTIALPAAVAIDFCLWRRN